MRYVRTVAGYRTGHVRNKEIRQELNILYIFDTIVENETKWFHNMERMDERKFAIRCYQYTPKGGRRNGCPHKRRNDQ
jgi:hypothetical protein